MKRSDFPQSFVFGLATAAYQIEGSVDADGRGDSIWDTFARKPGAIADGLTGEPGDDHYRRMSEDVALLADLGVDAYRFSLSWPRLQATGKGPVNTRGLDFYKRLADELLAHGIAPWVTLYHWDLPQELEDAGGWLERDTAHRFAEYSALAADGLGDIVTNWITLNEPWCSAFLGYASGIHAPGRTEGSQAARAAHHLLLGHGLAVPILREKVPQASVGVTLNLYSVRPGEDLPADIDATRRIDGLSNRLFLDPVLTGSYPQDVLDDLDESQWFADNARPADLAAISAPIDFLGINYYSRHTVAVGMMDSAPSSYPGSESVQFVDTGAPRTQMGWEIVPEGLIDVLEMAHTRAPELPLVITENGSAFEDVVGPDGVVHDAERRDYLQQHLAACADAVGRGLPLGGYFAWSLMDNFEWAWGYSRRFGLVHVDYETQKRTIKDSGAWFARFLKGSGERTPQEAD
jgi:beta-glucosidase